MMMMIIILPHPQQYKRAQVMLVVMAFASKKMIFFQYLEFWVDHCKEMVVWIAHIW